MFTPDIIKKIIDHFHIGKIANIKNLASSIEIETSTGTFYLLFDKPLDARTTEEARLQKAETILNKKLSRILNVNNEIKKAENAYVHKQGFYFSLYHPYTKEYFIKKRKI